MLPSIQKGFLWRALASAAMVCFLAFVPHGARADSITYSFTTWITGGEIRSLLTSPPYSGAPGSLGSITFTDDPLNRDYVDVSVIIPAPLKILSFGFNFDAFRDPTLSGATPTSDWFFAFDGASPGGVSVTADEDGIQTRGGGNYGDFDVQVGGSALTSASTQTFTGALAYEEWTLKKAKHGSGGKDVPTGNIADLDVDDFAVTDTGNNLYAWIHVGGLGKEGADSITLGATPPPQLSVSEPATLVLLGLGLVGVAGVGRRKAKP
jgi:hypothetical protein